MKKLPKWSEIVRTQVPQKKREKKIGKWNKNLFETKLDRDVCDVAALHANTSLVHKWSLITIKKVFKIQALEFGWCASGCRGATWLLYNSDTLRQTIIHERIDPRRIEQA